MKPALKRLLLYLLLTFGIVAVTAMFAQDKPAKPAAASQPANPPAKPASPSASPSAPAAVPLIPPDHRAEFFKRQLALSQAQAAFQSAQQAFQSAIAQLAKDCGEKYLPQISQQAGEQQGDPVCMAKIEPPKPAAKPAEKK